MEVLTGVAALRERKRRDGGTDKFPCRRRPASGGERRIAFDTLLCARSAAAPAWRGFGLEALGIPTGATVATDDFHQTRYPNIPPPATSPAYESPVAARAWRGGHALFGPPAPFPRRLPLRAPPPSPARVARVGLNGPGHARSIAFERFHPLRLASSTAQSPMAPTAASSRC